jgi:hypothetical protein
MVSIEQVRELTSDPAFPEENDQAEPSKEDNEVPFQKLMGDDLQMKVRSFAKFILLGSLLLRKVIVHY